MKSWLDNGVGSFGLLKVNFLSAQLRLVPLEKEHPRVLAVKTALVVDRCVVLLESKHMDAMQFV